MSITTASAPLTRSRRVDVDGNAVEVYYRGSDPTAGPRVYVFADDAAALSGSVYDADTDRAVAAFSGVGSLVPAIRAALGESVGEMPESTMPGEIQATPAAALEPVASSKRAATVAKLEALNAASRAGRRASMERDDWTPQYSYWRHGGSYVDNIVYPSGAAGCIASARATISGKFEVACAELGTFKTRDAAAHAERAHAMMLWREWDAEQSAEAAAPVLAAEVAPAEALELVKFGARGPSGRVFVPAAVDGVGRAVVPLEVLRPLVEAGGLELVCCRAGGAWVACTLEGKPVAAAVCA